MKLYLKAFDLGAIDFGESIRKDKRFYVVYNNKYIHFGSRSGQTFYDHHDEIKRKNWYKRHSKIYDNMGCQVINNPYSPSYWSARLLW
jgi:hypothetical protein